MKEKYYETNMQYLCECNNITPEELRLSLDMSKLQFYSFWYKASNAIAQYFDVPFSEFMFMDLRIPKSYRYLSVAEQKELFCEVLIETLDEIDEWKVVPDALVNKLYGCNMYKQAAFQIEKEDYTFVIIMNLPYDSNLDDGCTMFLKDSFAYGYVKFESEYVRYFKSFENKKFKILCDKLLQKKNYSVDLWKTREQFLRARGGSGSFNTEDIVRYLKGVFNKEISFVVLFGKSVHNGIDEIEQLELLNRALQYINLLKEQGNLKTIDVFSLRAEEQYFLSVLDIIQNGIMENVKDSLDELEDKLGKLIDFIKEENGEKEEHRLQLERKKRNKDALYQEMKDARTQLGRWDENNEISFKETILNLTMEEFLEQLSWIEELSCTNDSEYADICEKEKRVLTNFIWAKRIYIFQYTDNEPLYDDIIRFGSAKEKDVCLLLKYIDAYKNNKIVEYYHGLSSVYAEILVFLFGFLLNAKEELCKLQELHLLTDVKNALLDNLYEDICVINRISDGTIIDTNYQSISSDVIYELSQAEWTNFFEDSDDKIMYKACDKVYESVAMLFSENQINLNDFFSGRNCKKPYRLFKYGHNVDIFATMVKIDWQGQILVRNSCKYHTEQGQIYLNGIFETIELLDENGYYSSYPLVDKYLATLMWKYMENYLRIISKYKTKCVYKYGGYYCFDIFFNDKAVPAEIRKDYIILKDLLETNKIRDAVYKGMDVYFESNPDELNMWKDIFKN